MDKLFNYLDYRQFMKERFALLKATRRGVTHRSLSEKAGFSSPNFLKLVMDGHRNLTQQSIPKVGKALDLNEKELLFFEKLVLFNQAKTLEEKETAYQVIKAIRRDLPLKRIEHSQFEYFDHWYSVAIREMIELEDFQENPDWISQKLNKKVTPFEVKKSLELLERLGLIQRDEQGKIKSNQAPFTTGDEVSSLGIYRFHQSMIQKGKEALYETPAPQRDISGLTISVSEELFATVKTKIRQFRKEVLELVGKCQDAKAVYQLNVQFFNLTEVPWQKNDLL